MHKSRFQASVALLVCNTLVLASHCCQAVKAAITSPFDNASLLDDNMSFGSDSLLEDAASDTDTYLSWTTIETSSCETAATVSTCETCFTTSTFESALHRRERGAEVAAFLLTADAPHNARFTGPPSGSDSETAPLIRHNSLASNYSGVNTLSPASFRSTTGQLSCSAP